MNQDQANLQQQGLFQQQGVRHQQNQNDLQQQGFVPIPGVGPVITDPRQQYDGSLFLTHPQYDPEYVKRHVDIHPTVFSSQGLIVQTNPIPLQPNPVIPSLPIQ